MIEACLYIYHFSRVDIDGTLYFTHPSNIIKVIGHGLMTNELPSFVSNNFSPKVIFARPSSGINMVSPKYLPLGYCQLLMRGCWSPHSHHHDHQQCCREVQQGHFEGVVANYLTDRQNIHALDLHRTRGHSVHF